MPSNSAHQTLATIAIDKVLAEPAYSQAYRQLRDLILNGRLPSGARLPSTRDFALDLGVSRKTVLCAYDQLMAEGYLRSRPGAGTYVEDIPESSTAKRSTTDAAQSIADIAPRGIDKMSPLSPAAPDMASFPFSSWARCSARAQRLLPMQAMFDVPGGGYLPLRQAISTHIKAMRGIVCDPSQVIITSGLCESINLILRTLVHPDSKVCVEYPYHPATLSQIKSCQVSVQHIAIDEHGLCADDIVANHADAAAIMVTPSRQFPLGMPLSLPRRIDLLDWAAKKNSWIIEDDYDCEFRFAGRPIQSMFSLDNHQRTLYLGSLSKVLFPNLRLSFILAPQKAATEIIGFQNVFGALASLPTQAALSAFIESGQFGTHIRKTRRLYARRYKYCLTQVRSILGDFVTARPVEGGMHFAVLLRPDISFSQTDTAIGEIAAKYGLGIVPLSLFYGHQPEAEQGFLIGFSGTNADKTDAALLVLKGILRNAIA